MNKDGNNVVGTWEDHTVTIDTVPNNQAHKIHKHWFKPDKVRPASNS